jgi:hypothetical protein
MSLSGNRLSPPGSYHHAICAESKSDFITRDVAVGRIIQSGIGRTAPCGNGSLTVLKNMQRSQIVLGDVLTTR